ncbi:MAG: hypothetical protein ACUVRK_03725 [Spirochaetota bacterium]
MELHDIIKNDEDRLFVISPECYILFTGDSLTDEKPFIRIGNSLSLPSRIIPLIENIIVTDLITGDPSIEQYNIDPRFLSSNRYIGSKLIVKRYLEFQKIFGLDLHNATIVDIEKDIPKLSKEQIISDRETFLGVFYTDSNFKILHNQKTIFDLKELHEMFPGDVVIHSKLSQLSHASRYAGCGFVVAHNSLMVYKNTSFSTINFPSPYYLTFSMLQIDPATIRDVIVSHATITALIPLIKWKNTASGKLRIFYDNADAIKLLQQLFNQCTIHHKTTKSLVCDNPEGISIKTIGASHNYSIVIKNVKPATKDVTLVYIHDASMLTQALQIKANCYLIDYALYKKAAGLLTNISPIAIIHLTNESFVITKHIHCTINNQYDIKLYTDHARLLKDMLGYVRKEIANAIDAHDFPSIEKFIQEQLSPHDVCNIEQTVRMLYNTTSDRGTYKIIDKLLNNLQKLKNKHLPLMNGYRCTIMLCDSYAYSVYEKQAPEAVYPFETLETIDQTIADASSVPQTLRRIPNDRKRLETLLDLFYANNTSIAKEAEHIERVITKRKQDALQSTSIDLWLITKEKMKRRLQSIKKLALMLLSIMAIALVLYGVHISYTRYKQKLEAQKQARYIEYLTKKYAIHISDKDIFLYANDVAVKNGYSRIDIKSLKEKNPHWIYPGNRFILLDGEIVIVKPGDTLWGISEKKLLHLNIAFYTLIDELEKNIDKGILDETLAQKALNAAIHQKHREKVKGLIHTMNELKAKTNIK